ncbi:unnamed protein product [Protopolystoma xenopodis]|uniref:Uncharacterized protein n=1 Tax=Protopolystoma xenopodis TaxID=117903 RepID=A0A448X192_9PLAT|nr:unnamed protein product [Protopolystoma xenopodis]
MANSINTREAALSDMLPALFTQSQGDCQSLCLYGSDLQSGECENFALIQCQKYQIAFTRHRDSTTNLSVKPCRLSCPTISNECMQVTVELYHSSPTLSHTNRDM